MNTSTKPTLTIYQLKTLKTGKKLTWQPGAKGGRWRKKFDGEVVYFGSAKSKHDHQAYKAALAAAEAYVAKHNAQASVELDKQGELAVMQRVADRLRGSAKAQDALWAAYWASHGPAFVDPKTGERSTEGIVPDEEQENRARARWEQQQRKEQEAAKEAGPVVEINALLDLFLAAQKQRQQLTEHHADALPKKKRLTQRSYQAIEYGIEALREYAKEQKAKTFEKQDKTEQLLNNYRDYLMQQLLDGKIKRGTLSGKVKHLGMLFTWLNTHHHIDYVPRNLKEVSQQLPSANAAKPADVSVIDSIWKQADTRLKCFIALGLNCAMYTSEISELRAEHLVDGYIAKHRRKTEAPYKIKLWPLTLKLIEANRDDTKRDTGGLLFVTSNGCPLWSETEKGRTDSIAQRLGRVINKLDMTFSWKRLRNTTCEHIERLADVYGVGKELTSAVLQHTDKRMAGAYLSQEPRKLSTVQLDKAIDELENIYGLKWKAK